jgi:hypothetical protein
MSSPFYETVKTLPADDEGMRAALVAAWTLMGCGSMMEDNAYRKKLDAMVLESPEKAAAYAVKQLKENNELLFHEDVLLQGFYGCSWRETLPCANRPLVNYIMEEVRAAGQRYFEKSIGL